jgi:hypothetical protein
VARMGLPFPNPFRPGAAGLLAIPFRSQPAAPSAASARIRIYDVRGRMIRSLASPAPASGGLGSVDWDGRDERGVEAAAGVYWIHVRAPGVDDARSVVLLR